MGRPPRIPDRPRHGPFTESYREYLDRVYQEDRDTVREEIDRAMRERSDYSLQYRAYAPGSRPRSVAARGRFIYREDSTGPDGRGLFRPD